MLAAPLDDVWAALTDQYLLAQWLGDATIEARIGGSVRIDLGPAAPPETTRPVIGTVLTCAPPESLEFEWDDGFAAPSTVRFDLARRDGLVTLTLNHRLLAVTAVHDTRVRWHALLDRLTALLHDESVPPYWIRYEEALPLYETPQ